MRPPIYLSTLSICYAVVNETHSLPAIVSLIHRQIAPLLTGHMFPATLDAGESCICITRQSVKKCLNGTTILSFFCRTVSLLLTLPPSKQKGKRYHISAQFAQFSQRSSNNVELRKGSFRQKDTIVIVCFIIHLSPHYERTTLCYTVRGSFNLSPKKAITYCSRLPHYYLTVIFYFCKYLPLSLPLFTLVY